MPEVPFNVRIVAQGTTTRSTVGPVVLHTSTPLTGEVWNFAVAMVAGGGDAPNPVMAWSQPLTGDPTNTHNFFFYGGATQISFYWDRPAIDTGVTATVKWKIFGILS